MNNYMAFEALDRAIFSAFCQSFTSVTWNFNYTSDQFDGYDAMATAITENKTETFDVELKSVFLKKLLPYCYFQPDKWLALVGGENNVKVYFVIYPLLNKIAVWRLSGDLLKASEKDIKPMNRNTLRSPEKCLKHVYLLELNKAKVFDVDLTQWKDKYNALYLQTREKKERL